MPGFCGEDSFKVMNQSVSGEERMTGPVLVDVRP